MQGFVVKFFPKIAYKMQPNGFLLLLLLTGTLITSSELDLHCKATFAEDN